MWKFSILCLSLCKLTKMDILWHIAKWFGKDISQIKPQEEVG